MNKYVKLSLLLLILIYFINYTKVNFEEIVTCSRKEHKSYEDCYNDLWKRNFGSLDCKVCNTMYYTIQIRQNKDKIKNYKLFMEDLKLLLNTHPNFPNDCRHIGSFLTNISQSSDNQEEVAMAKVINMYIQMEKLHISFSDGGKYINRTGLEKSKCTVFKGYVIEKDDLFTNIHIIHMKTLEKYPILLELYKRSMKLLISEKRSITSQIYTGYEKKSIDSFIK